MPSLIQRYRALPLVAVLLSSCSSSRPTAPPPPAPEAAGKGDGGVLSVDGLPTGDVGQDAGSEAGRVANEESACPVGQHRCADGCVADTAVATCGRSCTPCPQVRRGTASCDGAACQYRCPDGFALCRDRCIPREENCSESCGFLGSAPLSCGQTCVADAPNSCCSHPERCGAFGCRENRCLTRCQGDSDCAAGQVCDPTTAQCGPCGGLGQVCCWDVGYGAFECTAEDTYCTNMKCAKLPGA
jgi:hypothetical protein